MYTKMKTVQEHLLNTSKALKPTENAKINASAFIIARQFLQMEFVLPTEARYADEIQPIVHHSNVPHLGYILSKSGNGIITLERPFSVEGLAAYRQYWLQKLPKLSGIADVDIAATLFTYDMLAKEHEEYWI
ncbi:hypothetical protein T4D_3949, partial [Trichinella pseudospiralis]